MKTVLECEVGWGFGGRNVPDDSPLPLAAEEDILAECFALMPWFSCYGS